MTNPVDQEELALFRESVIKALETEVAPHYEAWEKSGIVPRELWNTLGDAGMLCVDVPEQGRLHASCARLRLQTSHTAAVAARVGRLMA